MQYFDYLNINKGVLVDQLEILMNRYKVESVGSGYIDCIVHKDNLEAFIMELSKLGVLITAVSWWCYVNPNELSQNGCPHGMGGPKSKYYEGWFSELQNEMYELDEPAIKSTVEEYDKHLIGIFNLKVLNRVWKRLEKPFRYTPNDYIMGNKCLTPALWLLVPDDW
ncbi:hypothetical protein [Alkaliphilus transvaalensis]|uniref:hypothetical protein n=1 Tax=Alkaliphilus transvaalensis TaxID=114628 RepID=UPI00047E33E7|nr:hypothetical protein [Alkaliphilus transvaalensis]